MVSKCSIEACKGVSSGKLKITDKETLKEIDVCAECYNCGDPAIGTDLADNLVCKDHRIMEVENE